ncbi:MAG: division/cell wall cluster transcriptional repressor MraZ [Deltaproteobacteria bacterium]|nr:division/cell wall cluster transcriptional repressor MraZ [Deltaproteobacteria bacterium]
MFRGKFDHNVDLKGRLSVPSKFREYLKEREENTLVMTNSISNGERFLDIFPLYRWEEIEKKVSTLSQVKTEVQNFQRYYLSQASDSHLDKAGRILIPSGLREYAGLEKEVVVVGMLNKIELWSKEKWERIFKKAEEDFENIMLSLSEMGL